MNTAQLRRAIRKELDLLNKKIDEKIVRGLSYAREARRHKFLLSELYNLNRVSSGSWLSRILMG